MAISKTLSFAPLLLWTKAAGEGLHRLSQGSAISDSALFLKNWLQNPAKVGAILPSWPALSAAITREINADHAPVLELGSGTGAFTRRIIKRGIAAHDLILVETDPAFASHLQAKFPPARILCSDACRLYPSPPGMQGTVGAAVCGLPLLNMSTKQQFRILHGVFCSLRQQGALYLFSYGLHCPIPLRVLDRLGLRAQKLETVLLNAPPARVWKITRRQGTWLGLARPDASDL